MTQGEPLLRLGLLRQVAFSAGTAVVVSWAVPFLLMLTGPLRWAASWALFAAIVGGSTVATAMCGMRLRRHRFLLRSLPIDEMTESRSKAVDLDALGRFVEEPWRLTLMWLLPQWVALLLFATPLRPELLDQVTGTTVWLLGSLLLATASLPLNVMIRRSFLGVIEHMPGDAMRDLVAKSERQGSTRGRIHRRLVLAVATPVIFVTLGCALIVNAHLRRADEQNRKETARILARSALQLRPGTTDSLERAIERAQELGFTAQISAPRTRYGVILERGGILELTTPLDDPPSPKPEYDHQLVSPHAEQKPPPDAASATLRFSSSTVNVASPPAVLVALLAAIGAAVLGYLLANVLSTDLYYATRGVRVLGTNPALAATGTAVIRRARLRIVNELFEGIERLADRFAIFAEAQEDAIAARAAATRMRGLFFASVSHDLKSPLNSILGFTQLVSLEPLTTGQRESLEAIHSRAQELLALIETILDAARVEEGQLSLVSDEVPFGEFYEEAIEKAAQLCASLHMRVFDELDPGIPPLLVDRVRVVRALATLIAYSVRSSDGGKMWIRAERESEDRVRLDVDVPSPKHSPEELEEMLSPSTGQGRREHRGLALGLRLARSVVELHAGAVRVIDRGKKGAMFCITLPTVKAPLPTASAPAGSIPPPPASWRPE
jgi:signal transduction histidine kinase